jgi:hypothetical protein
MLGICQSQSLMLLSSAFISVFGPFLNTFLEGITHSSGFVKFYKSKVIATKEKSKT